MATVSVDNGELVVTIRGMRKVWSLKSEITIPIAHVKGATVDPGIRDEFPRTIEKRVGTNLYQTYYGGTFVQDGDKVFWDVRKPENAIVITLDNEDFDRLVVEVENPRETVELVEGAVGKRP
ncbi:hypothetical protein [Amycolatopsis pigmentata]|uniref:Uncharacterized protein n=1 Tax=Amycolatopsis pigmentata TaxID=450801 RepID=A0ABW5FSW7_9PSEU